MQPVQRGQGGSVYQISPSSSKNEDLGTKLIDTLNQITLNGDQICEARAEGRNIHENKKVVEKELGDALQEKKVLMQRNQHLTAKSNTVDSELKDIQAQRTLNKNTLENLATQKNENNAKLSELEAKKDAQKSANDVKRQQILALMKQKEEEKQRLAQGKPQPVVQNKQQLVVTK